MLNPETRNESYGKNSHQSLQRNWPTWGVESVIIFLSHFVFNSSKQNQVLFNSIPNDKILDWFKLKALADDKLKVAKMMIFLFDRVDNTVGNGENAGYQHFLLFPVFCKTFFFRVIKSKDCVVKS